MSKDGKLYLNGINGETGQYLVEPMELADAAGMIKGIEEDNSVISWLRSVWARLSQTCMGPRYDLDPTKIKDVGWAIVFHQNESWDVRQALQPLIDHRKQQVGDEGKVKVLSYRDGQNRAEWLAGYYAAAGSIDPERVPFYLLFVGSPKRIPYGFCQEINVEYAVGRLCFDTVEEYSRYVASIIEYENSASVPNAREAVFFGARHDFDKATQMSADLLVKPLADGPDGVKPSVAERHGFVTRKLLGDSATRSALIAALRGGAGAKAPAFLFTASHGMGFSKGHERQLSEQGALLCQDWPGFGQISPAHYFAASDLPAETDLRGLVTFHFACFSGGTPEFDNFMHAPKRRPPRIAPHSFIAALPKALLAHPKGGALACIGHVERAWGYSISAPGAGPQLIPFENAIGRLLVGQPVGYATKDFNEKFAALSTSLSNLLEQAGFGASVSDLDLANAWVERNDAGGYIVIGDPAARLRVEHMIG